MIFSSKTQIPPSATITINSIARHKESHSERIFNLSAGQPILDRVAPSIKKMVTWAVETNQTLYPPAAGIDELRARAAQWINSFYKTNYQSQNVLVTCGGKFGIYLLFQSLLNDDDEVIVIAPYWVSYPSMVKLFGGAPVIIDTTEKNNWKADPLSIQRAITQKTKILILNNGSNPTGALYTKKELEVILKIAAQKNIIILSDEVYSGLTYDNNKYVSCGAFPRFKEQVVVVQSCSKNFGMTGWRVGFVFGSEEIIKMLVKIQGQSITGTSTISQWAAIGALKNAKKITKEIKTEMQRRRDFFVATFNKLFTANIKAPRSAFYCFIPLSVFGITENDSVKFCEKILEKANVAMVPGIAFGKEGYVRCSFGAKEKELKDGLIALRRYLQSLI